MLREMNNLSRGDHVFLQDGARSHTAKATLEYLNENCPAYVKPDHWPPNSPDLNALNFAVWGRFEKKFGKTNCMMLKFLSTQSLKNGEIIRKK